MTGWRVTARSDGGELVREEVEAASREEVIVRLRERGLVPVSVREKPREYRLRLRSGVGRRQLAVATRQLATMVAAGVPLVRALEVLVESSDDERIGEVLGDVRFRLESGATLADALRQSGDVFPALYVNMVEAGEEGGVLDTVLERLATLLEKRDELTRTVRGSTVYPAVVLLAAVGAVALLMIYVIPAFEQMFAGFDRALPLPTRAVLGASDLLRSNLVSLLVVAFVAAVGGRIWARTDAGILAIDRLLLRTPVLGGLARKSAVARFTRTLEALVGAGVPILDGLAVAARTSGSEVVRRAVLEARSSVARGASVARPLEETGVFPPMVTQMIRVGEETGRLDEMLAKSADFYEGEVDVAVASVLRAVEPAMMVLLGLLIGTIIVAMYLPIFDVVSAVGAG